MNQQQPQTCITSAPGQAQTHDKRPPSTQYKSQETKLYGSKETSTLLYHSQCSSSTPIIQLSDVVVHLCVCVRERERERERDRERDSESVCVCASVCVGVCVFPRVHGDYYIFLLIGAKWTKSGSSFFTHHITMSLSLFQWFSADSGVFHDCEVAPGWKNARTYHYFRRVFDRLPVRNLTSDLHSWILRKNLSDQSIIYGVQFSFNIMNCLMIFNASFKGCGALLASPFLSNHLSTPVSEECSKECTLGLVSKFSFTDCKTPKLRQDPPPPRLF